MTRARNEVLVGTGALYTAPEGEAFPDLNAVVSGNWLDVGYSDGGWALAADFTFEDVNVAEEVDPIDVLKTAQQLRLVGAVAQPSLENFAIAFNGGVVANDAGPPDHDTYIPDSDTTAFTPTALLLVVAGTAGFERQYRIQKAMNTAAFSVQHGPAPDKALLALEFRLVLPDTGAIFEVHEANV
jgi:hypothetical protein